jgi:hypothetical protein
MYKITDYTKQRAKELNVIVKPSTNKNKKIDVFNLKGDKLASVGAIGYLDYPNYIKSRGLEYANERRRLYLIRHSKTPKKKDGKFTPSYYADNLLW